jgi:hypothetical protein
MGLVSCGDMVAADSEILVAHRSRSVQGRVHFMTTFVLVVMQDWDGMDLQDAKTPNASISETV